MARLGMSTEEYAFYIGQIREAFDLIGQEAWLYQVKTEEKDLYRDPTIEHKEVKKIGLVFEENPKPILKKMNWLTEDEELPYVAYIVALASDDTPIKITEYMKVRIQSKLGLESDRLFVVSKVTGNSIDPLVWICKLVPYRYKVDINSETERYDSRLGEEKKETGYNYLRVSE